MVVGIFPCPPIDDGVWAHLVNCCNKAKLNGLRLETQAKLIDVVFVSSVSFLTSLTRSSLTNVKRRRRSKNTN